MMIDVSVRHANSKYNAKDIKKAFTNLGWKYSATGYLPQSVYDPIDNLIISGYTFVWNSPSKPIYPENIAYQIVS